MRSLIAILPLAFAVSFIPKAAAQYSVPRDLMITLQARGMGSYLGVRLVDIDIDRAKVLKLADVRGAEVFSVLDDSPAQEAGLKPGFVLLLTTAKKSRRLPD